MPGSSSIVKIAALAGSTHGQSPRRDELLVSPGSGAVTYGLLGSWAARFPFGVVASDGGAYPEIVGNAAVLVPPGDHGALADTLEALLERTAEREKLAAAARVQAAHHTWDATATQLANLVAKLR